MRADSKDMAAGLIFISMGAGFGIWAFASLRLGGPTGLGPAFFPVLLGALLVFLGALICLSAVGKPPSSFTPTSWRGVVLVTGSILFFAEGMKPLGFAPALFGSVLMAAKATNRTSWTQAIAISVALTAFSVAVFVYALNAPIAIVGPWLGGY